MSLHFSKKKINAKIDTKNIYPNYKLSYDLGICKCVMLKLNIEVRKVDVLGIFENKISKH